MADGVEILDVRVADDLFFAPQDEDIADITMGRCPAQRSTMSRAEDLPRELLASLPAGVTA